MIFDASNTLIYKAEELGKNPRVGKKQIMKMMNFQALRRVFCNIFAGILAGRFCRKNNVIVVFVVFAFHFGFKIYLG